MTQLPAPSEPGSPHPSRRGLLWGVAAAAAAAGLGVAAWLRLARRMHQPATWGKQ